MQCMYIYPSDYIKALCAARSTNHLLVNKRNGRRTETLEVKAGSTKLVFEKICIHFSFSTSFKWYHLIQLTIKDSVT